MTTTRHGQIQADSREYEDSVFLTLGDLGTVSIAKDVLVAITAAHAVERPNPRLGESRFRSADAQILAARADTQRAEAEVARLRRALDHVRHLGLGARFVAGGPLEMYAATALNGGTE